MTATGGEATVRLAVPEMDCPTCAGSVEDALRDCAGVRDVATRPASGSVSVTYDPERVAVDAVVSAVERAGYPVAGTGSVTETSDAADPGRDLLTSPEAMALWVGAALTALGLALAFGPVADPALGVGDLSVADALFLGAVTLAGRDIVRGGLGSIRSLDLDMDLLMTAAIVGALVASLAFAEPLFFEAATLAVLFGVAELLESYAVSRARRSLRELVSLAPDTATVRRDGDEQEVPVEAVAVGERVVVAPGEQVPLDGTVVDGEGAVDESPVTGESVPVDKAPGDPVYGGTINESGYFEVEVTAAAEEGTLARVVELVERAQDRQTKREQFVDRFAGYYTPVVVAAALTAMVLPPLVFGASTRTWFLHGIALLVIACPCAFVISTPVSVVSGITSAARNGVLVRGGDHLEALGEVEAVALDKTGTLTTGDLEVTDVVPLEGNTEADVLACARGVEARSRHPVAEAIVGHAGGEVSREVADFESLTGAGVRATLDGEPHYAGKPGLFDDLGFDLDHVHVTGDDPLGEARDRCAREGCLDLLAETIPRLRAEGKTVVLVGTAEELEGVIAVADAVRPEAAGAVAALREAGVEHVALLTGDNEGAARVVAEAAGVDEFHAGLLPEDKVAHLEDLAERYDGVAMVGDGVNDAPALATATVGVAMGAAGTDAAVETADVALLGDDLGLLPYARRLARRTNGVVRQNVYASLGVKALLALGVPFGLVPVWLAVLAGDAGMTTAVTANASRLAGTEPLDEAT